MIKSKLKKIVAVFMAVMMWFCSVPVVPILANTTTKHVVTQDSNYTPASGETVYDDVPAAINALGEAGGTIYVKGAVTTAAGLENGTITSHGLVKIVGYTGASTDSLTITKGWGTPIYGDITFENLKVTVAQLETHGYKVTFGTGVVIGDNTMLGYDAYTGAKDIFVIDAGTYVTQYMLKRAGGTANKSFDWTLNNGTIDCIIAGNWTSGAATTINGDILLTQNGGKVNRLYLGSFMQNNINQTLTGNLIYVMNDGEVPDMFYGGAKKNNGTTQDKYNNIALIFNNATMTKNVHIGQKDATIKPVANHDILVLNNYENNKVTIDKNVSDQMEYILHVTEGKAEPVFERTDANDPSSSTFKGFAITADTGENWAPYVGEQQVIKNTDGYYDLSAYTSDSDGNVIEVEFKKVAPSVKYVVTQDSNYTPAEGENVYSDVPEAIIALGEAGGTIRIKGKVKTVAGLENGSTASHGLVKIVGYTGATTDSLEITKGENAIYGDITFENLKVTVAQFETHGKKVTFGTGVVIGDNTMLGYDAYTGTKDIFVIDAGTYVTQYMLKRAGGTANKSFDWTLNNGTIDCIIMGNWTSGAATTINGDILLTQNGGKVNRLYIGSFMQNNTSQTLTGNLIYVMNDGEVPDLFYGGAKKYNGTTQDKYNNIALIFNNATMTKNVHIGQKDVSIKPVANHDILVLNNYENNKVTIDKNVSAQMEYVLRVTGGKAEPVFERTDANDPATSTFKGFTIVADAGENLVPYVGDKQISKNTDGYYDLSAYTSDDDVNVVAVEFKKPMGNGEVVVTQDSNYTPVAGEKVYSDIPEAIIALGEAGGTIYVKGKVKTVAGLESGSTASHGLVKIVGYTGATTDSLEITKGANALYGDITFENLTVTAAQFETHGKKVTFGTGVVIGSTMMLGYDAYTGKKDIFVIDAGTYVTQYMLKQNGGTANKSFDWTLNNGTIDCIITGNWTSGAATTINGDILLTQNGGKVNRLYLGSFMQNNTSQTLTGNLIYVMNDGEVPDMFYGGAKKYNGTTQDKYNNIALIFNNATMTKTVHIGQKDTTIKPIANHDILILNNYENNKVTIDKNVSAQMNYILHVTGGKAEPVFERTDASDPATSVLKGFSITADEGTNPEHVPTIGGVALFPKDNGLYDLSAYMSAGSPIDITFGEATNASIYVNFRNDFSKSYAKLNSGETVNVVYFGGSMTQGYGSSNQETRSWRGLTKSWLNAKFPNATINHINLALGESGTYLGTFRTPHDIINKNPDVLFIEYSINDKYFGASYAQAASQFETIIREVKAVNPDCDIVTVLVTDEKVVLNTRDGILHTQAQAHEDISTAYGIPSINVGKALADRFVGIDSTTLGAEWDKYSMNDGDIVHLNDSGYAIYFSPVKAFLEEVYSGNDNSSYNTAVEFPTEIVSTDLFDGDRTIIDGEKTIVVENSDKAPVTKTTVNLKTIVQVSNANGGTGFVFDEAGRFFGSSYSYAENYKGTIKLPANTNGKLVFEMTGTELAILGTMESNSTFKYSVARKSDGYVITDGATCTVGGTRPTKVFSNYKSDTYIVILEFASSSSKIEMGTIMTRDASKQTVHTKYEKLYVKYGGTGDGTSTKKPAKSVAWLINNVISKIYDATDVVEIYIMQDDEEILYNSSKQNSSAPKVGNGRYITPDAHFAAWTSSNDGVKASHEATIVIKSYEDGTSKQNYLGYKHQLGWNTALTLQGPTVFEDISLVTCYSSMVGIYADGFDMTFNDAVKIYTINASRYWTEAQAKAWDGEFKEVTPYYTQLGIGNGTSDSLAGLGGKFVINKVIKNQWIAADNSSSYIIFGDETNNAVFGKDVALYVNSASSLNIRIGSGNSGNVNKKNTFEKNMNFLINAAATVDFNANSTAYTDVLGAVQIIRNASATVSGLDAILELNPVGGYWNLKTDYGKKEAYLDVTETAGIFSVTEGLSVAAIHTETGKVIKVVNGILDLSQAPGSYDVYCLDYSDSEDAYINYGKMIYVTKETKIDLATVEPHTTEGYAFLGWKLEDGTLPTMSNGTVTEKLSAGTVLVADYAEYSVQKDGDFFISNIEMRPTNGEVTYALRYIVELKDAIFALVGGKDKVVEFGSLVLPLELSQGKDIRYNKPIYNYDNQKILGTPSAVPAKNIYKQLDGAVQYTVAVMNFTEGKYDRFYSVQGYVRYIDENGVERVLYSQYGQSSLYKEALELTADTTADSAALKEANTVIDYVENERAEDYDATYSKRKVALAQAIANFNIYRYTNKLCVSEFTLDWYGNDDLTEIVQVTDTHFVYKSEKDVFDNYEPTLTTYESSGRQWYESLNIQSKVLKVMEYASFADKTIVTGDVVDYVSDGTMQVAERLLWGMNTAVGIRKNATGTSNILATVGNHEILETLSGVDYGTPKENILSEVQEKWSNDILYHSEMVYNKDGKNGAMVVLMDNGTGKIDSTLADKLKATIEEAREKNAPVLLFMHVPISDGTDELTVPEVLGDTSLKGTAANQKVDMDNKTLMGGSSYTDANGNALYDVITENADIIRGVFVGHAHGYMYNEVAGTGAASEYVIPQFVLAAAHLDAGYVLKINIK